MLEEMRLELEYLEDRKESLCYLMIEAEGEAYNDYLMELDDVETEIAEKTEAVNNIVNAYRTMGAL